MTSLAVPLIIDCPHPLVAQPIRVGVPFPRSRVRGSISVDVIDPTDRHTSAQTLELAHWADGSVKWLLCDLLTTDLPAGRHRLTLVVRPATGSPASPLGSVDGAGGVVVETAHATLRLSGGNLIAAVQESSWTVQLGPASLAWTPVVNTTSTHQGHAEILGEGISAGLRYVVHLFIFPGFDLVRADLTIRNPRRARHRGGLWDLGDPNAHPNFGAQVEIAAPPNSTWQLAVSPETGWRDVTTHPVTLVQNSSGGECWNSPNHVGPSGQPTRVFRGYRLEAPDRREEGQRASPVATSRLGDRTFSIAVPEFWQQFPKAMRIAGDRLTVELATAEGTASELQPGEQKTFSCWLTVGSSGTDERVLAWVHDPALAQVEAGWYEACHVLPFFAVGEPSGAAGHSLTSLMAESIHGRDSFFAKRERADEYGWRHFGDLYADHENEHYEGPHPVVSHYNNQYDGLNGLLLQYLRTGDRTWWQLADPLARHIYDIDIYHTDGDRAAYNGGMFWHTDHYRSAATATHRAYSRANKRPGAPYGGGPSNEHNWGGGLLTYYYLTGDARAREAILGLAEWVLALDDGSRTLLGLIDDGPTGRASRTGGDRFHGPGRGGGNSISALLDAWQLTTDARYLEQAERLMRRCIHPADDLVAMDITNPEHRWSYTVFLSVLARYIELKLEHGQCDDAYGYARAALVHYGNYMAGHERPYFDQAETLDFPNETWAAQEMRKANVLRLAARHCDIVEDRRRMEVRGDALADRAWADIARFETRTSTRCLSIMLTEGPRDGYLRGSRGEPVSPPGPAAAFGVPQAFLPQRARITRDLRTPRGAARALGRLLQPGRWLRALRARQL